MKDGGACLNRIHRCIIVAPYEHSSAAHSVLEVAAREIWRLMGKEWTRSDFT